MAEAELEIVRLCHWGRWISAVVIVAALATLGVALAQAKIDWASVPEFLWYRVMAVGLLNTVLLAVIAQSAAIVIGIVIALMRRSANLAPVQPGRNRASTTRVILVASRPSMIVSPDQGCIRGFAVAPTADRECQFGPR